MAIDEVALPFGAMPEAVAFAGGPSTIDALWIERTNPKQGDLYFSSFDGTSWSETVTIARDVDLVAARDRALSLEVLEDGPIRARWFDALAAGGSAPHLAGSDDLGDTWHRIANFPAVLANGTGPISWSDVGGERQAAAWIELSRREIFDEKFQTVFVAVPGEKPTALDPLFVGNRAAPNAGISTARRKDGLAFAYRRFGRMNRVGEQQTNVYVDVIEGGKPKRLHGDHDRWALPSGARGVGPVLASRDASLVSVYYSDSRQGYPALLVWQAPQGAERAFPTIGRVRDLHAHFDRDGRLVVAAIETGYPVVRRFGPVLEIARLDAALPDPDTTLVFAADLAGREYLAWETAGRITLVRTP